MKKIKISVIIFLIGLTLIFNIFTFSKLNADVIETWDGQTIASDFTSGDGTSDNPYLISSGSELAYFANQVNNGNSFAGKYLKLNNDIDLNKKQWTPIGNKWQDYNDYYFAGNFDGDNKSISNLYINYEGNTLDRVLCGLFGYVLGTQQEKAVIQNINLIDSNIILYESSSSYNYVAPLIAVSKYCDIINCNIQNNDSTNKISLEVIKGTFSGGIIAQAQETAISYSSSNIEIQNKTYGQLKSSIIIGGLVGYMSENNNICKSSYEGNIVLKSILNQTSSGVQYAGGLVGLNQNTLTIENCYSTSDIITNYTDCDIGGIVGTTALPIEITKCFYAGGISQKSGSVAQTSSICNLWDASINSIFSDIYFIYDDSASYEAYENVEHIDSTQLANQLTFTNFDFDLVWYMDTNENMPKLKAINELPNYKLVYSDGKAVYCDNMQIVLEYISNSDMNIVLYLLQNVKLGNSVEFKPKENIVLEIKSFSSDSVFTINLDSSNIKFSGDITLDNVNINNTANSVEYEIVNDDKLTLKNSSIYNNKKDYAIYNNANKELIIENCIFESEGSFLINQNGGNVTIDSSIINVKQNVFLNYEDSTITLNGTTDKFNTININIEDNSDSYCLLKNNGIGLFKFSSNTKFPNNLETDILLSAISINNNQYQIECLDNNAEINFKVAVDKNIVGDEDYYIGKQLQGENNLKLTSATEGIYIIKNNEFYIVTKNLKAYLLKDWKNILPFSIDKIIDIEFILNDDNYKDLSKILLGANSNFSDLKTQDDIAEDIICYYEKNNDEYSLKIYSNAPIICPDDSSNLFSGFSNLKSLVLQNLNFENVVNIDNIFADLINLPTLDLTNLIFGNLESYNNVFLNSDKLYDLILPIIENDIEIDINNNLRYCEYFENNVLNKSNIINKINKNNNNKIVKVCFELTVNSGNGVFDKVNTSYAYDNNIAKKLFFYDEKVGDLPNASLIGFKIDNYLDTNSKEFDANSILSEDTLINIVWKEREDIEYKVEIYYQELADLNNYTLNDSDKKTFYGTTNDIIILRADVDGQNEYVLLGSNDNKILLKNGFIYYQSEFYNGDTKVESAIINPNENEKLLIKIYCNRKSFNITLTATTSSNGGGSDGGRLSFDANLSISTTTALFGQSVNIYIRENDGYEIKSLIVKYGDESSKDILSRDNLISLIVTQDMAIEGEFELQKLVIFLNGSECGTIKFIDKFGNDLILANNNEQEIYYNSSVYVKFVAGTGYKFKRFILSNNEKYLNNPLTINNIVSEFTISVEAIKTHTIIANYNDENGTVKVNNEILESGNKIDDIETQSQLEFIFIPKQEYFLCNYVKINNKNVDLIDIPNSNNKKLILIIEDNLTIEVEFDFEKFAVEFITNIDNVSTNSIIEVSTNQTTAQASFKYSTNLKFVVSDVKTGYRIKSWEINNNLKLNQDESIFKGNEIEITVTEELKIVVEFEILITIEQNQHGLTRINNNENSFYAELNSNLSCLIDIDRGYQIDSFLYDISDLEVNNQFEMTLTKPIKVGVTFKSKVLKVTLNFNNQECNAKVESNDTNFIIGSELHFIIKTNEGYLFTGSEIRYLTTKYQGAFNKELLEQFYTVTVDDVENSELIIDINTKIIEYVINFNIQGKGQIQNSKLNYNEIRFSYFEIEEIILIPNNNYRIKLVNIIDINDNVEDMTKQLDDNKLVLPKKDCTINIIFTAITWLDDGIRATSFDGGNGSKTEPFLISTPNQLALMSYLINNGEYNNKTGGYYSNSYYKLTKDVSLNGNYWVPIGINVDNLQKYMFTGVFDYQYHRIRDSLVEDESIITIENNVFGVCHNAKFINKEKVNYMLILGIGLSVMFFILFILAIIIKKKIDKKPKRVIVLPNTKISNNQDILTNNNIQRPDFNEFFKKNKK